MEEYVGVKFETIVEEGETGDVSEFLELDRMLGKYLRPKGNEGNMSLRAGKGFLIKKTGTRMTSLDEDEVAFVKKVEDGKVYAVGGIPSSESIMHYEIYKRKKNAKIILHFHDDELLGKLNWRSIGPFSYGSKELAESVADALEHNDRIEIRGHGFVITARNKGKLMEILDEIYR